VSETGPDATVTAGLAGASGTTGAGQEAEPEAADEENEG
jgi:hypothetical protein